MYWGVKSFWEPDEDGEESGLAEDVFFFWEKKKSVPQKRRWVTGAIWQNSCDASQWISGKKDGKLPKRKPWQKSGKLWSAWPKSIPEKFLTVSNPQKGRDGAT